MSEIMRIHYYITVLTQLLVDPVPEISVVTYVMSIQKILWPLLINNYVCGCRIAEFPAGVPRQWFGLLYMLLLWSFYIFLYIYKVIPYIIHYSIVYHVCHGMKIFTALLTIIVGIYYDKAFKNCIKSLTIVDNTLEKLGIITIENYNQLRTRLVWLILGLFLIFMLIMCGQIRFLKNENNYDIAPLIYVPFANLYCFYANTISDFIIMSMLGYVSLKFDQINEYLEKLTKSDNGIKRAWEHPVTLYHQFKNAKVPRTEYMIWIVIHLYLELRKVSRKIDSIFGIQMTLEIGCCFVSITLILQEIFNVILINDYVKNNNKMIYIILIFSQLFTEVFRLFLFNYICEKISIKANATRNVINKLSYFSCDVETRENILQFLLMTQLPIRFCGFGLFQFGYKFIQGFITSVATVVVILIQSHTN